MSYIEATNSDNILSEGDKEKSRRSRAKLSSLRRMPRSAEASFLDGRSDDDSPPDSASTSVRSDATSRANAAAGRRCSSSAANAFQSRPQFYRGNHGEVREGES